MNTFPAGIGSPWPTAAEWETIYRTEAEHIFDSDEAARYQCRLSGITREMFVAEYVVYKMAVLRELIEKVEGQLAATPEPDHDLEFLKENGYPIHFYP